MSLATVYNTLETLAQHGKVREITIDPEKKHFDPNTERHHHLICSKCKTIADIYMDFALEIPDKELQGFEVSGSHVEFYGLCPKCRKPERTS